MTSDKKKKTIAEFNIVTPLSGGCSCLRIRCPTPDFTSIRLRYEWNGQFYRTIPWGNIVPGIGGGGGSAVGPVPPLGGRRRETD